MAESRRLYASSTTPRTISDLHPRDGAALCVDTIGPPAFVDDFDVPAPTRGTSALECEVGRAALPGPRGSFIDSVLTAVDDFSAEFLGTLRTWSAAPPKLRPAAVTPPELDDSVPAALASTAYSSQDGAEVANVNPAGKRADTDPAVEAP